jgi:hypothetical protein
LVGLAVNWAGEASGRSKADGVAAPLSMVYMPPARFASSCGVGASGRWKFAGGWLVSTTWIRSPAGIRVKLASSEMSYRVVWPGTTACWLPRVNRCAGASRTEPVPYQLCAWSSSRWLPSSTPSACLTTVPAGDSTLRVAVSSVSVVVDEA